MKEVARETIKTVCQASHSECGVLVHVEDGQIVEIEGDPDHPMNRGKLCPKGIVYTQLLYHPGSTEVSIEKSWRERRREMAKDFLG